MVGQNQHKACFIIIVEYLVQSIEYHTESEKKVKKQEDSIGTEQVSVVCPHDHRADWERWLVEKVLYCFSLAWENINIQNSKYGFYQMHTPFAPSQSQKIGNQTVVSWGLSIPNHILFFMFTAFVPKSLQNMKNICSVYFLTCFHNNMGWKFLEK